MSTLTTRVGLFKPAADGSELVNVVTDLNNNLDKIDSWLGATVCTSGTRPGAPWAGQIIRESDTAKMYCWSGAAWVQLLHGTANYDSSINLPSVSSQLNIGASGAAAAFSAKRTNSTDLLLSGRVGAETNDRFSLTQAGGISWGPGSAGTDTNLYRSAANLLKTDDSFEVAGTLAATGAATLGSTLAVTGTTALSGATTVANDYITGGCNGINAVATTSGSNTMTSATYTNMAGTGAVTSFSFTKRFSSAISRIRIMIDATCWVNTTTAAVRMGVNINGVNYDVCQLQIPVVSQHVALSGVAYLTGIAAGSYTVQGVWYRVSGTGTLNRDLNDWLSISAEEVSI